MKDAGIAWAGQIPNDWSVEKGKYCFYNRKDIVGIKADDYERLALTLNGVVKRPKEDNNGLQPEKFETYQIIRPNELVFKLIDLQNVSTSRVGYSKYKGIVSPAYIVLKGNGKVLTKFAEKYYLMLWMYEVFNHLGDSGVRSSLNCNELLDIPICFPNTDEQQRIADYLDKKCGEIDGLISDIEKEIEVLTQYKKSIITETVTKGLNKDITLKNSGIEWAKQIPEHWEVIPNKYLMKKIKNICPKYTDEKILSLTMNGVIVRDLDAGGKMPTSFDGYQIVKPGNLLMCLFDIDVTPRCVGLINDYGLTSPAYSQFVMKEKAFAPYYYYYYLMLDYTKELLHLAKNLRHSFTEEQLGTINTPVPPIQEQREIAEYLDKKCKEIDSISEDKNKQLETLERYKKSIIYEYVTGKKEVI